ncbi:hypothetical protein [Leptospira noguchii]|uniref:hypothetical protein n=1 Tax=Leptospira noguchii TaxID=28182 RepID=UPI002FC30DB8
MLYGDFVFDISLLQTILFALFAILTLFQGRLIKAKGKFKNFNLLVYSSFFLTSIPVKSKRLQ